MSSQFILIIIVILVFAFSALPSLSIFIRRKKLSRRTSLSFKEIYDRYFKNTQQDPQLLESTWKEVAQAMSIPSEKLLPDDRWDNELRMSFGRLPIWGMNDGLDGLISFYDKNYNLDDPQLPYSTLGEFVCVLASRKELALKRS